MTKILIVDDMVDAAQSLEMLFQALGHDTRVAYDGRQAVIAARDFLPHIVLLDLNMPVLDGYGAAREIRAADDIDDAFLVALSGLRGADVQRDIDAAGFDFYLVKPVDINTLLALTEDLSRRDPHRPHPAA